jgi:hypothetical protein
MQKKKRGSLAASTNSSKTFKSVSKFNIKKKKKVRMKNPTATPPTLMELEKRLIQKDDHRKVTMSPSKNIITEIERPIPYNKRLNSPTLRKVKLHYERIRCYKIQKENYEFRV